MNSSDTPSTCDILKQWEIIQCLSLTTTFASQFTSPSPAALQGQHFRSTNRKSLSISLTLKSELWHNTETALWKTNCEQLYRHCTLVYKKTKQNTLDTFKKYLGFSLTSTANLTFRRIKKQIGEHHCTSAFIPSRLIQLSCRDFRPMHW